MPQTAASGIETRFGFDQLIREMDYVGSIIIATIRTLATIITVLLILSVGYTLWQAKDGVALEIVKVRIFFIFIGLLIIFIAEPIANFIFYLMRW